MLKGDLASTPLPEVLRSLAEQAATGCLHVDDGRGDEALLYLKAGAVYAAYVPGPRPQLASRLVSAGLLAPEALEDALHAQRTELQGWRLGELLVHLGYVPAHAVEAFALEQLYQACFEVSRWADRTWRFRKNEKTREEIGGARPVEELLGECTRREAEWLRREGVVPSAQAIPSLSGDPATASEIGLDHDAWALLSRVDGARSVGQLACDAGFSDFEGGAIVERLVAAGLVEVGDGDEDDDDEETEYDTGGIASSLISALGGSLGGAAAAAPQAEVPSDGSSWDYAMDAPTADSVVSRLFGGEPPREPTTVAFADGPSGAATTTYSEDTYGDTEHALDAPRVFEDASQPAWEAPAAPSWADEALPPTAAPAAAPEWDAAAWEPADEAVHEPAPGIADELAGLLGGGGAPAAAGPTPDDIESAVAELRRQAELEARIDAELEATSGDDDAALPSHEQGPAAVDLGYSPPETAHVPVEPAPDLAPPPLGAWVSDPAPPVPPAVPAPAAPPLGLEPSLSPFGFADEGPSSPADESPAAAAPSVEQATAEMFHGEAPAESRVASELAGMRDDEAGGDPDAASGTSSLLLGLEPGERAETEAREQGTRYEDTASLLRELSSLGLDDDEPPRAPTGAPGGGRPAAAKEVPKKRKGLFGR